MTEEWKDLEQDVPTLTLDPGMLKEEKTKSQVLTEERQPEPMDESILSEEERSPDRFDKYKSDSPVRGRDTKKDG